MRFIADGVHTVRTGSGFHITEHLAMSRLDHKFPKGSLQTTLAVYQHRAHAVLPVTDCGSGGSTEAGLTTVCFSISTLKRGSANSRCYELPFEGYHLNHLMCFYFKSYEACLYSCTTLSF